MARSTSAWPWWQGPGLGRSTVRWRPGRRRRPVYQLWPALTRLRLFGAGYRPLVARLLGAADQA